MSAALDRLDSYDVVVDGTSATDRGAMPLGNGVLCASVWVSADAVCGYLSRSDALTELDRTVKVCGFRVGLGAGALGPTTRSTLRLRDGVLEVRDGSGLSLDVWVDGEHDVLWLSGTSPTPRDVRARLVVWRTEPSTAVGSSGLYDVMDRDTWTAPDGFEDLRESADVVASLADGVMVTHVNGPNLIPAVAALHGLAGHVAAMPDLLTGRRFGALLTAPGGEIDGDALALAEARAFEIAIATASTQHDDEATWLRRLRDTTAAAGTGADSAARTRRRWNDYWSTSWVDVRGDTPAPREVTDAVARGASSALQPSSAAPSPITQAYVLTKWMTACAAGGPLPILYNGSLFTLMPGAGLHLSLANFGVAFTAPPTGEPTAQLNPDERSWSVEQLWQNLRLPYHSMLQRGEHAALAHLFAYYRRFWDLNRARARLHHGAEGQWSTEMSLTFGLQSPAVYGTDRAGLPDGYSVNRWGGGIDLSPGLELVDLMFDYYRHTGDQGFLASDLLPYADDLAAFVLSRYALDDHGRLRIGPINSVETYFDTTNPLPVVAGLHALVHNVRLLEPQDLAAFHSLSGLEGVLPLLPVRETPGGEVLSPATEYVDDRKNVESPELYAIFPFRVHTSLDPALVDRTVEECARIAGTDRPTRLGEQVGTPSYSGWQYQGPVHALLGHADQAAEVLRHNAALSNPGHAFPAMWGPIYDAVPDVDHGANIMTTLQLMLLRVDGPRITLLPAWPRTWDVRFRLFADAGTSVEVDVVNGSIRRLEVLPAARRADVVLPEWADI